jgi:hypothetical protein
VEANEQALALHRAALADQLLSDALALQEKALARPGPEIASTLQSLALARRGERRYDDASRLQRRAVAILAFQ